MNMNLSVADLEKALGIVGRTVDENSKALNLQSLGKGVCLLSTADGKSMTVTSIAYSSKVDEQFDITLNYDVFKCANSSAKIIASEDIRIVHDGQVCDIIIDESSKINIPIMESKQYVPLKLAKEKLISLKMDTKQLKNLVEKAGGTYSEDPSRGAALCGINIEYEDNILKMTSIDGYRLGHGKIDVAEIENTFDESKIAFIVAGKEMCKLCNSLIDEETTITIGEKTIRIKNGVSTFISLKVEGAFLDYEKLLTGAKEGATTIVKVNKHEFLKKVKFLSSVSSDKLPIIFNIDTQNNVIELETDKESILKSNSSMSAECEGESLRIGFNSRYIQKISYFADDDITLLFRDAKGPLIIKSSDFTYFILPINLK